MAHILNHTDGGLITADNAAVVFIDHQPQMTFGVANIDRQLLINNVVLLAKAAKEFRLPSILTAVETESFSGYIWPQLMDIFPEQQPIERTSMNSWDDAAFREAVKATRRKNIIQTHGAQIFAGVAQPFLKKGVAVEDAAGSDIDDIDALGRIFKNGPKIGFGHLDFIEGLLVLRSGLFEQVR